MTKHSQGPWEVKEETQIRTTQGNWIAETNFNLVYNKRGGKSTKSDIANARLIASAVELLEMCKEALEDISSLRISGDCGNYDEQPIEIKLKQVIYKAEGK